jgi:glycosyltransferase involved in cell wall biosynthesis
MTNTPIVSIVLPVFNGEKYVAAAIESVRRQTLTEWELLIVDDGSQDTTPAILAGYARDPRVRIQRQDNRGLPAARNAGLGCARGQYAAFLDADDLWQPAFLEKMLAALEKRPEAVLALAGWQYVDKAGQYLPQSIVVTPAQVEQLRIDLDRRNSIIPVSVVVRLANVEACGRFDETLRSCEDWDLWLRLRPLGDFVAVPEVLVGYRTHSENMSDNIEQMEAERRKVVEKHFAAVGGTGTPRLSEAMGYILFLSALAHLQIRYTAATERLRRALVLWPGLLDENEFFYELGCAFQARGYRGTPIGLNVRESGRLLQALLHHDLGLPAASGRLAWGRACLVLSQLGLLAGDRAAARQYALSAIIVGSSAVKATAIRRLVRATLPQAAFAAPPTLSEGR